MIITKEKINELHKLLQQANHVLITSHKSPDGDSVGSSLGLYHYLNKKGIIAQIIHPDGAPDFLHWLPAYDQIINLDNDEERVQQHFGQADLIFCLDYNSPSRIGQLEKFMNQSNAAKVMIDHHREPDTEFCQLIFSDIEACSTSQLVYEIIDASDDAGIVDEIIGTPLYAGIVTDTGSFRFSSTRPKTHQIAAELIEKGVKHWEAHEHIYDTNSLDKIQMVSYALLNKLVVVEESQTAYISLSAEEQSRFNTIKGDTEGLVNMALGLQGIKLAAFFKEADGIIKISFRSKGDIPVNELAKKHFSGGGHLNASGGKFVGGIDKAINKFVTILPTFVEENKACFE